MIDKDVNDPNPKIDPAPNSNTKEADDWVSGDDPMTGAQASYLKTLSEECDEPESFRADLTKAEASKRIDYSPDGVQTIIDPRDAAESAGLRYISDARGFVSPVRRDLVSENVSSFGS